jgi:hypothetical protein
METADVTTYTAIGFLILIGVALFYVFYDKFIKTKFRMFETDNGGTG